MKYAYTLTQFTPGEAERITGLSTAMQRDWRRREYLPANEGGHARFDVFDLAAMLLLKVASTRGIGPAYFSKTVELAAGSVAHGALKVPEAFEGDAGVTYREHADSIVRGRKKFEHTMMAPVLVIWANGEEHWNFTLEAARSRVWLDEFLAFAETRRGKSEVSDASISTENIAKIVSEIRSLVTSTEIATIVDVLMSSDKSVRIARHLATWPTLVKYENPQLFALASNPAEFLKLLKVWLERPRKFDERTSGVVTVIDQPALGRELARSAGRPLVHVELIQKP